MLGSAFYIRTFVLHMIIIITYDSTAPGYTDPFLSNVDLRSMCDSGASRYPSVVASRDLSRVGIRWATGGPRCSCEMYGTLYIFHARVLGAW